MLVNDDLTRAQQDSILRSVSSAAGIVPDRGDTVSVEPLPFSTSIADRRAAEEQAVKDRENRVFYMEMAGLLLVVALIVGAVLMYRRKKRLEQEAIDEEKRQEELEKQRFEAERAAAIEAGEIDKEELTPEEQQQLTERQAIEDLIKTKPAEVAMLIKTWLSED